MVVRTALALAPLVVAHHVLPASIAHASHLRRLLCLELLNVGAPEGPRSANSASMSAVAAAIESTTLLGLLEVETNNDTVTLFGLGRSPKILQTLCHGRGRPQRCAASS